MSAEPVGRVPRLSLSPAVLRYKLRAASISVLVFLLFATGLFLMMSRVWYPGFLFWLDGGLQGLLLVTAVDFVMGPLLVTVFVSPGKSRGKLLFDVLVVVLLQLSMMGWGVWQVWSQRPLAVVYGEHRFISVAPAILRRQGEDAASLLRFSAQQPPLLYRREPVGQDEARRMMVLMLKEGIHPEAQAWLFETWTPARLGSAAQQAAMRAHVGKTLGREWQKWAAGRTSARLEDYRFAFFEGRYSLAVLVFSTEGQLLGYLDHSAAPLPDLAEGAWP